MSKYFTVTVKELDIIVHKPLYQILIYLYIDFNFENPSLLFNEFYNIKLHVYYYN